jgi:hypothetical protein
MDSDVARVFERVDQMYDLKAVTVDAAPATGGVAAKRLAQLKAAKEEGLDASSETGEVSETQEGTGQRQEPEGNKAQNKQRAEEQQPEDGAEDADYREVAVDHDAPPF